MLLIKLTRSTYNKKSGNLKNLFDHIERNTQITSEKNYNGIFCFTISFVGQIIKTMLACFTSEDLFLSLTSFLLILFVNSKFFFNEKSLFLILLLLPKNFPALLAMVISSIICNTLCYLLVK